MKFKPNTKRAAIGSLMNTMGRVGGNQKKMKPMAISASNLSNKPPKEPQLGDQQGNRFMQQSNALQAKTASSASPVDVSPYLTSTAHKSSDLSGRPYTEQSYTNHLYTKLASMESMLTKTIPGLFKALPDSYTSPVTKAIQDLKEKFKPAFQAAVSASSKTPQSASTSDGVKSLGSLFSNIIKQIPPTPQSVPKSPFSAPPAPPPAPPPASSPPTVSRFSMLSGSNKPPLAQKAQAVNALRGPGNSSGFLPNPDFGGVSNKKQELMTDTAAPTAPMTPKYETEAPPKTIQTTEELQRLAAKMDAQGRYNQAGLGVNAAPLTPEKTYQNLVYYIDRNRARDLHGLPPQHLASFNALPKEHKDSINRMLSNSAIMGIQTSPDKPYEPAFGSRRMDDAMLSAGEGVSSLANVLKIPLAGVGILDDQKPFRNVAELRHVLAAKGSSEEISNQISALDTKVRNDYRNGAQPNPADISKLNRLLIAKKVSDNEFSSTDINAKDYLPNMDPDLTPWERAFGRVGSQDGSVKARSGVLTDLLGTFIPGSTQIQAAQSLFRLGLNAAGVRNADAKADLIGVLAPRSPRSFADGIKNIARPKEMISGMMKTPVTSFLNLYPRAMLGKGGYQALTDPDQRSQQERIKDESIAFGNNVVNQFQADQAKAIEQAKAMAAARAEELLAKANSDRSRLYNYLLGAGLGIPAIMAIMGSMGRNPDEEPDKEEEGEESPGAANVKP